MYKVDKQYKAVTKLSEVKREDAQEFVNLHNLKNNNKEIWERKDSIEHEKVLGIYGIAREEWAMLFPCVLASGLTEH